MGEFDKVGGEMNRLSLIIGADICPTKNNIHLFENGDAKSIVGAEILNILQNVDFRIFNLECPLIDEGEPIPKSGAHLSAKTTVINGIKMLNPSLLTLANNHTMDYGEQGLKSTIECLQKNDIPFVGVDSNEFILEKNGIKIGIYVCAEHEFGIESTYFDPLETPDKIFEFKRKCNYLAVLYHGGKEYYRYPSPLLRKRFKKMAEKGANIVIAQHTHCIGCQEKYNNSTLVYGQGNFIFKKHKNEFWNSSLLIKIEATENDFSVEYIPVSENDDCKKVLADFETRSKQIQEVGFIENEYRKFASKYIDDYLLIASGNFTLASRGIRKLFKKNIVRYFYSKQRLLHLQNSLQCEAHSELFLSGLIEVLRKLLYKKN